MAMNRVQFQPGLSMTEFMDLYGSDEKCEAALVESRWPAGFCVFRSNVTADSGNVTGIPANVTGGRCCAF